MDKFEYDLVYKNRSLTKEELNGFGKQGWELVQKIHDTGFEWTYIFKRKIIINL